MDSGELSWQISSIAFARTNAQIARKPATCLLLMPDLMIKRPLYLGIMLS
jgi:hypothetical protein